jgi:hypothetical protein
VLSREWNVQFIWCVFESGRTELRSLHQCAECAERYTDNLLAGKLIFHSPQWLFGDLAIAREGGSLRSLLARLNSIDVLVIDD